MMKKVLKRTVALALAVIMTFGMLTVGASAAGNSEPENGFTDIGDKYYAPMIEKLAAAGIIVGVGNKKFAPDMPVSRAMAVTILGRMAGVEQKESDAFTDVEANSWYSGYVGWGTENNIVFGAGDGHFEPDRAVTGEEMDLILSHYAELVGFTYSPIAHSQSALTRGELAVMIYNVYVSLQLPSPSTYSIEIIFDDMFGPQPGTLTINTTTLQWILAYENMYGSYEIGGWYDDATFNAEITNDGGQGAYLPVDAVTAAVSAGIQKLYEDNNIPRPVYSSEIIFDDMFGPQPGTLTINTTTLQWILAYKNMYGSYEIGGWYDDATFNVEITNDGGQGAYLPVDAVTAAVSAGIQKLYEDNNISSAQGNHVHRFKDGVCTICRYECPHPKYNPDGVCTQCYWRCTHPDHDSETLICRICGQVGYHTFDDNGVCSCGKTRISGNADDYKFSSIEPMENSPLKDKTICVLGSSVVFGAGSKEEAVGEFFAARFDCKLVKEAVSGTTLADNGSNSYVQRMLNNLDKDAQFDLFICQLSTNDASKNLPMGEISSSKELSAFDMTTTIGAMEYIICYAQKNWGCPVVFFTNSRFDDEHYGQLVAQLKQLQSKWSIGVLDLWSDDEFNNITDQQRELYMNDLIHPTKAGYRDWWGPEMEKQLLDFLATA